MDGLSPETRALLARAEGGEELSAARRLALRGRIAGALGVAAPLAAARMSAAAPGKYTWLKGAWLWAGSVRALGAVGFASLVSAAAVAAGLGLAHRAPAPLAAVQAEAFVVAASPPAESIAAPPAESIAAPLSNPGRPSTSRRAPLPRLASAPPSALRAPSSPPAASAEPDLAVEAHILAKAQAALSAGNAADALTLLDDHDARFPGGELAPESGALRVTALCASGRTDEARVQAQRVHARFPSALPRASGSPCDPTR